MVEKPSFDKIFKGSKTIKTIKQIPIGFYKTLKYFIMG